jgi:hypothetical protein
MENNKLSGSVPSEIGLLTALTYLYHLTSTILPLFSPSAFRGCYPPKAHIRNYFSVLPIISVFHTILVSCNTNNSFVHGFSCTAVLFILHKQVLYFTLVTRYTLTTLQSLMTITVQNTVRKLTTSRIFLMLQAPLDAFITYTNITISNFLIAQQH